jgi:hypothetical protein
VNQKFFKIVEALLELQKTKQKNNMNKKSCKLRVVCVGKANMTVGAKEKM